jgi:REP element-mobilizing transposase RayT
MRKPRQLVDNGRYHVIARTNRGEHMLRPTAIKQLLVWVLEKAKKKYRFRVETFCIMDNHVHMLLVVASGESLSGLMQWMLSVFAIRYNRLNDLKGHVWYDRFTSTIVATRDYYLTVIDYILRNPVQAGIVKRVVGYPWTALQWWRKPRQNLVEPPDPEIQRRYRRFLRKRKR